MRVQPKGRFMKQYLHQILPSISAVTLKYDNIVMKIHNFIVLKKSNVLWYLNISRIKYSIKCIWRPIKALKLLNLSFSLISESLKTLRPVILKVKNNGLSFHSAIMNRRADACYITKHTCNWSIEYCSRDYRQFDN